MVIGLFIAAFLANIIFTGWFVGYAERHQITDIPTERSSHVIPTPRGGGLGFVFITIISLLLFVLWEGYSTVKSIWYLMAVFVGIAFLGWRDDKGGLSRKIRFVVQIVCGFVVLWFISNLEIFYIPAILDVELAYVIGLFLGLLWLTGATNMYNFMDGVDGIAALQGLVASLAWGILGWYVNEPLLFAGNTFVFATLLAFLFYNWSPAKIFMGDVGSVFLGFWFASTPFFASSLSPEIAIGETIWFAAIVLWPFLFDGSYTIFRRYRQGENIFDAHRSHLYQRLNIVGWSHKKVALLYGLFALVSSACAGLFLLLSDPFRVLIIGCLFLLSIVFSRFVATKEEVLKHT